MTDLPAVANGPPFVAIRPCGHVLSQRAAREVGGAACPVCGAEATATVEINGPAEVVRRCFTRHNTHLEPTEAALFDST